MKLNTDEYKFNYVDPYIYLIQRVVAPQNISLIQRVVTPQIKFTTEYLLGGITVLEIFAHTRL